MVHQACPLTRSLYRAVRKTWGWAYIDGPDSYGLYSYGSLFSAVRKTWGWALLLSLPISGVSSRHAAFSRSTILSTARHRFRTKYDVVPHYLALWTGLYARCSCAHARHQHQVVMCLKVHGQGCHCQPGTDTFVSQPVRQYHGPIPSSQRHVRAITLYIGYISVACALYLSRV